MSENKEGSMPIKFFDFGTKKKEADEQDKKPWDKRIKSALVCGILATIAVPTIGTILSYYS